MDVTSPVGFWPGFSELKVGGAGRTSLQDGLKGGRWVELVAETTPT